MGGGLRREAEPFGCFERPPHSYLATLLTFDDSPLGDHAQFSSHAAVQSLQRYHPRFDEDATE